MRNSIGSAFLLGILLVIICQPSVSDLDSDIEHRANYVWATKLFVQIFSELYSSHQPDLPTFQATFNAFKSADFQEDEFIGIVENIRLNVVNSIVGTWSDREFLSATDERVVRTALEAPVFKVIKETAMLRSDNVIVFGVVGFMRLGSEDKISIIYNFRRFKLSGAPIIQSKVSISCIYWGIYCETKFGLSIPDSGLKDEQIGHIFNYLRLATLRDFARTNDGTIRKLAHEGAKYKIFLSDEIKVKLNELEANPDKRPDQVLDRDPFDPNVLDM